MEINKRERVGQRDVRDGGGTLGRSLQKPCFQGIDHYNLFVLCLSSLDRDTCVHEMCMQC